MSSSYAQLEYQRVQLLHQLDQIAESMRKCATVAEKFAHAISGIPLTSGANTLGDEAQLAFSPVTPQVRKPRGPTAEEGESEVVGSKRKRSARKPKDPNAPKRPPSNYLLFQNEVRAELKSKFPQLPNSELLQMISKRWAAMADADKEVYSKQIATAKEAYVAQKATYDATSGGVTEAATVTPSPALKQGGKSPIKAAAPAPAAQTSSSDSSEESRSVESSEEGSGSEDEEEQPPPPPPKKTRRVAPAVPKEKKEKKV